jgi:PAS domain S-box-containing protein
MKTKPGIKDVTADILNNIQFGDVLNIEDIQRLQDLFSDASGVASLITQPDGTAITKPSNFSRLCQNIIRKTEKGCANCIKSDTMIGRFSPSGTVIQPCLSGGLWDAGARISVGGKHIANWLIGQVRNEELDEQRMLAYADEIGTNREEFLEALKEVPVMSFEQLNKVSKMLFAFANELSEKAYTNLKLKIQIAEQEKVTEALQEKEVQYRNLADCGLALIWATGTDKLCSYFNEPWLKFTGRTLEHELGNGWTEGIHPMDFDRCLQTFTTAFDRRETFNIEYRLRHVCGEYRWILDKATPNYNVNGDFIGYIGNCFDITELKQAEAEIKLKNERLNELVVEKDKLFSIIAHDLRNPINSFLGLTQIMAEKLPTLTRERIQQLVESMKNSASNLFRLLENLLYWASIQQDLIPFDPKVVRLLPFIEECIAVVLEPAKSKGIKITYNIPDDLMVYADSNILQTIIRNLVSNALKFTPKGGVISLSAKAAADNSAVISVKDSGIGMNRTMVDDLFRLDVKTNRKGTEGEPSMGFGLLLCKEFVGKHGGKLSVESEEGKGSIFYFNFPCKGA